MNKEECLDWLCRLRSEIVVYMPKEWIIPMNNALEIAIKALEQEPCEMTAEEYRQRMIQAFHNADTDELIAVCVLPTEKEFEHLEWLLKNHYKKKPCADAISRSDAIRVASGYCHWSNIPDELAKLPSVNTEKTGRWIYKTMEGQFCSICDAQSVWKFNYCPNCGARMEVEE